MTIILTMTCNASLFPFPNSLITATNQEKSQNQWLKTSSSKVRPDQHLLPISCIHSLYTLSQLIYNLYRSHTAQPIPSPLHQSSHTITHYPPVPCHAMHRIHLSSLRSAPLPTFKIMQIAMHTNPQNAPATQSGPTKKQLCPL